MATRQGGNFAKNASICDRRSDLRTTTWPVASKTLLAKSRPIVVIFMADGSLFARERQTAFTLWHPDAVSGSHPPHLLMAAFRTCRDRDRKLCFGGVRAAFDPGCVKTQKSKRDEE